MLEELGRAEHTALSSAIPSKSVPCALCSPKPQRAPREAPLASAWAVPPLRRVQLQGLVSFPDPLVRGFFGLFLDHDTSVN